jgi:hypothetical protein
MWPGQGEADMQINRILRVGASALIACVSGSVATMAETGQYLTSVQSPVVQMPGAHQAIAKRGQTCIAQILKPGLVNAPVIVSADTESGIIVANNAFEYSGGGFLSAVFKGRSTVTLEARDSRFRITQSSIEAFHDAQG